MRRSEIRNEEGAAVLGTARAWKLLLDFLLVGAHLKDRICLRKTGQPGPEVELKARPRSFRPPRRT